MQVDPNAFYGASKALQILRWRFPDRTLDRQTIYRWQHSPHHPLTPDRGDPDNGVLYAWKGRTLMTYQPPPMGTPVRKPHRHHAG